MLGFKLIRVIKRGNRSSLHYSSVADNFVSWDIVLSFECSTLSKSNLLMSINFPWLMSYHVGHVKIYNQTRGNTNCVPKSYPSARAFCIKSSIMWRHNERDGASNHQRIDCLLNRLFRRRSKKTSKFRVAGPCEGNSPVTGEFPSPWASNVENVSIWWSHHVYLRKQTT